MDYKEAYDILFKKIEKYAKISETNWTKNLDWWEFEEKMREFGNERYDRGQMIVMANALRFAKELKEEVEKSAGE